MAECIRHGLPEAGSERLTIRPAVVKDRAEIARLLTLLGHPATADAVGDRWEEWAAEGNRAWVAARADGSLAGLITLHRMRVLHRPKPVGRITALVVDTGERGQGVGGALVATAEEELTRAGCGLVEITSNDRLTAAHAFYEHLGYERTSVRLMKGLMVGR